MVPPFLARMKVASAHSSLRSTRPSSASSPINRAWISSNTPAPAHSCRRRQQVLPEGRPAGMSCQRAPLRSSQRSPSRYWRSSARGRPPWGRVGAGAGDERCAATGRRSPRAGSSGASVRHDQLLSPTMKTPLSISGKTSFETVSTQPID
jgi:hypothetical protein